jgi:hypothetical protein
MLAELAALDAGADRKRFQLVVFRHDFGIQIKKPVSAFAKNGFSLALAVFVYTSGFHRRRPQADHQIGAEED